MLSQPFTGRTFGGVDARMFGWEIEADRPMTASPEVDDPLALAQGVLCGVLLCVPFWLGVFWLLTSG